MIIDLAKAPEWMKQIGLIALVVFTILALPFIFLYYTIKVLLQKLWYGKKLKIVWFM